MSDWMEKIKELGNLRAQGLITEEEFQRERDIIMGSRTRKNSLSLDGEPLAPGTVIQNYKILSLLGQGGMGQVYKVEHKTPQIAKAQGVRALKLMQPLLVQNPSYKQRFLAEAVKGLELSHPNIAKAHNLIDDGSQLGLVMEFVNGASLEQMGKMSVSDAISIIEPIAKTLDFLHSKGIVHRDIKPENIRFHPQRGPVVLDFGISKDLNMKLTQSTVSMGTPIYMSPEQMDAKSASGASDQYSLAMMFYHFVSGQFPWEQSCSSSQIIVNKMTDNLIALSQTIKWLPEEVSNVVSKALSRFPSNRYDSCIAFVQALSEAAGVSTSIAPEVEAGLPPMDESKVERTVQTLPLGDEHVVSQANAFIEGANKKQGKETVLNAAMLPLEPSDSLNEEDEKDVSKQIEEEQSSSSKALEEESQPKRSIFLNPVFVLVVVGVLGFVYWETFVREKTFRVAVELFSIPQPLRENICKSKLKIVYQKQEYNSISKDCAIYVETRKIQDDFSVLLNDEMCQVSVEAVQENQLFDYKLRANCTQNVVLDFGEHLSEMSEDCKKSRFFVGYEDFKYPLNGDCSLEESLPFGSDLFVGFGEGGKEHRCYPTTFQVQSDAKQTKKEINCYRDLELSLPAKRGFDSVSINNHRTYPKDKKGETSKAIFSGKSRVGAAKILLHADEYDCQAISLEIPAGAEAFRTELKPSCTAREYGLLYKRPKSKPVKNTLLPIKYDQNYSFWIGKTEFVGGLKAVPRVFETWKDAILFANRLSRSEGLPECYEILKNTVRVKAKQEHWKCEGYRLPTEDEWIYAARAKSKYRLPAFIYDARNAVINTGKLKPEVVCTKDTNVFGLCDMRGNLAEWVWTNKKKKISLLWGHRAKGGSFRDDDPSALEDDYDLLYTQKDIHFGLRLVRSVPADIKIPQKKRSLRVRKNRNSK